MLILLMVKILLMEKNTTLKIILYILMFRWRNLRSLQNYWKLFYSLVTSWTREGKIFFFLLQSLKRFTFRVKSSDSIFFLLGRSPIVKLIWNEKQILLSILRGKYCLIHLEIVKRPNKWNYNVQIIFKTR